MASKPKFKPGTKTKPPSKDLVKLGPRDVFVDAERAQKLREVKPTTSRALVLRNGKYGVQGSGEVALMSRISGREKLDLLAEDLVERFDKAVSAPFDIQKCLRIAETQYDAVLGAISHLHDHRMFFEIILAEIEGLNRKDPKKPDPLQNVSHIARTITTRIHNQYMLASAWKIVGSILRELVHRGMTNKNVKALLKNDMKMRNLYLGSVHMIEFLVDIYQQRFSVLALNSSHYARYFKQIQPDDPTAELEVIFDHSELREAALSFMDTIILELCFPQAPYPKFVLYQILHDAAEESPRETKRFSQLMWDAVGDLSECVELHQLLETPLLSPDAEEWKEQAVQMPPEFDRWMDVQAKSLGASEQITNLKDLVFPLIKTMRKVVLDNMWVRIDQNYSKITGKDIDDLWQVRGAQEIVPQWTSFYSRDVAKKSYNTNVDNVSKPDTTNRKSKQRLAITDYAEEDNGIYDDMPDLQDVSNSSDGNSDGDDSASEVEYIDDESDDESGYDTEEEEDIRELLRQAMDLAHEADWLDGGEESSAPNPSHGQVNPFLKLLGSLRGRLFNPSPKLRVRTPTTRKAKPRKAAQTSQKATVEEVTDEEEPQGAAKKKKKKSKKKKKPAVPATEEQPVNGTPAPASPLPTLDGMPMGSTSKSTPPVSPKARKKAPTTPTSKAKASAPATSPASLPAFETTTSYAQSARTYVSNLEQQKAKTKTRSDQASIFSNNDDKTGSGVAGLMSKLVLGEKSVMEEKEQKAAQSSWFSKLSAKTSRLMHHLLRTKDDVRQGKGGMRWDDFVKLMTEMGFDYDPSTAGSSVRFIPPGKDDHPISFHKPHPKPYIDAWKLRGMAGRLKDHYGWDEEVFLSQAATYSDSEKGDFDSD